MAPLRVSRIHDSLTQNERPVIRCVVFAIVLTVGIVRVAADETGDYFEAEIRPLLLEKCSRCHGPEKQSGGLRVDTRAGLWDGGDRGPAIIPGDASASLLIQAVQRAADIQMPPDEKLRHHEVQALERWVDSGARWPDSATNRPTAGSDHAEPHWAFQPVRRPRLPLVKSKDRLRTAIDAFVLARLEQEGLRPSPLADRRTLIRRATYRLTGLPPSFEEVERFTTDPNPDAYERLVDRLLASPHYGEQWTRHWLDVARYSDTKGYVYAREERFWTHAWTYRDWVVSALNEDLPYDRFLLLQLAADQMEPRRPSDLAAMGFLTLGRRFLGVQNLIIDDRIDVVTRGMMGLTVGCARCHNHKYDPIPTADYYSLYGVFASCAERLVCLNDDLGDKAYQEGLRERQDKLLKKSLAARKEASARARSRIVDYLHAQTELDKYPADGFDQIFQKDDLLPAFVRRWETYLYEARQAHDPVFTAWHAFARLKPENFAKQAAGVTQQLRNATSDTVNPIVADAFRQPPESFDQVIQRYGEVFARIDATWQASLRQASLAGKSVDRPSLSGLPDIAAEQIRQVLYGPGAPCQVPEQPIVHTETFFDSATCTELWKLRGEVDRWIIRSDVDTPYALTLIDRPAPTQPRVFRRGNPIDQGATVPRQFLSALSDSTRSPFQHGSGRLELAHAIINPANPLTARVMVNRIWAHHFGRGLVSSASDFGRRAELPSHPDLLDWLATRFVEEGWSLKQLHRWILLSATFRQAAYPESPPANSSSGPVDVRGQAMQMDPDNRLLWRMKERRLTFEELRDSMLAAGEDLDDRPGGKPDELFSQPFPKRRTLYGLVDRQFFPSTLRVFDFANPDLHIARRRDTTVPQQSLFFLNHPLVLERARAITRTTATESDRCRRVRIIFRRILQREPGAAEISEALELVDAADPVNMPPRRRSAADWQYGFGAVDEAAQRVNDFQLLPHFSGTAWQGGPLWPDEKLGWVQLTATGGHPGNDRQHAAIRRWTAPRSMTIRFKSRLVHEAAPGDGIRAFIVSSRSGALQSTTIHQDQVEINLASLAVHRGETIDLVVDIGKVLNNDQYMWEATISELSEPADLSWNSRLDFATEIVTRLTPWEQLAHVLFCTNEFLFVD